MVALEWAQVAPDCVVVATRASSFVRGPSPLGADPFDAPMSGRGSRATTRHLLEGALFAARARAGPRPRLPITPDRWAISLAASYCTTHLTPLLMTEASERFSADGRSKLAEWAREKAREERGHDLLALRDIEALGLDADAFVKHVVPETARALVVYFTHAVRASDDPIDCVGYAFTLERLALDRGEEQIAQVEAALPKGVFATRCLRVHSAVGSDRKHVDETIALVAALPARSRARVARACFASASVYYAPTSPVSEEQLAHLLLPFRRRTVYKTGACNRESTER